MNKQLVYIILLSLSFLQACQQEKKTNWNVTLDRNRKDPYACYIAYHHLASIYPESTIKSGGRVMTQIKDVIRAKNSAQSGHVIIVVCKRFELDSTEFDQVVQFVGLSNALCIFSEEYSPNIYDYFNVKHKSDSNRLFFEVKNDTIPNQEIGLIFNDTIHTYHFNGLSVNSYFEMDSIVSDSIIDLGFATQGEVRRSNMLIRYTNNGAFLVNKAPLAMTNYFLLQDDNKSYYEHVLSYFSEYPTSVTWFSFLTKYPSEETEFDWRNLFKQPALFFAFVLLIAMMILYVLFAGKRRQRIIPIVDQSKNTSLEFIETVGNLYFTKKDNANLAEKMIRHYLENIRLKYALRSTDLDAQFANQLANKVNQSIEKTTAFVSYLNYIRASEDVTDIDIQHLYQQLKKYS